MNIKTNMLESEGINPSSAPSNSEENSSPQEEGLQYHAALIHTTIGYVAKEPKEFEKTFLDIAILMHMEEQEILQPKESLDITEEFCRIKEGIYDGSVKISEIPKTIERLVDEIKESNQKAGMVASIIELEHLICVYPPHGQSARDFEEFHQYVSPIFEALKKSIKSDFMNRIHKEIEEIKFFLSERGSIAEALEKLQDCKDLVLRENF